LITAYFDSSVILSIILHEPRHDEAYALWILSERKVSSLLLRIETVISLRRTYIRNISKLDEPWLAAKLAILKKYLSEIEYMLIDETFETAISSNKELAGCRTLDAIHIATALEYRKLENENIRLYTFDTEMYKLAEYFKFITNDKLNA
jgi:predicted nucleic acid-binding protein